MPENIHQRICQLILSMAGHEVHGVRNKDLADALGVSPATISRDLAALEEIGFVEGVPGLKGRCRLGPKILQVSRAHVEGLARVRASIAELEQRFSRNPL